MTQFCGNLKLIRVTMQHQIIFKLKAETKSTCYQYNLLSKLNASYPSVFLCILQELSNKEINHVYRTVLK